MYWPHWAFESFILLFAGANFVKLHPALVKKAKSMLMDIPIDKVDMAQYVHSEAKICNSCGGLVHRYEDHDGEIKCVNCLAEGK